MFVDDAACHATDAALRPPCVLGLDAAWTLREPSGVALVSRIADQWRTLAVAPSYASFVGLADGVASAKPKMGAFLARFLPVAAAVKEQVKNMPKGSRQASIDRVAAVMDRFKEFAGKTY